MAVEACVEQSWLKGKSPDVGSERVLFANGFAVIAFADGTKKRVSRSSI